MGWVILKETLLRVSSWLWGAVEKCLLHRDDWIRDWSVSEYVFGLDAHAMNWVLDGVRGRALARRVARVMALKCVYRLLKGRSNCQ